MPSPTRSGRMIKDLCKRNVANDGNLQRCTEIAWVNLETHHTRVLTLESGTCTRNDSGTSKARGRKRKWRKQWIYSSRASSSLSRDKTPSKLIEKHV